MASSDDSSPVREEKSQNEKNANGSREWHCGSSEVAGSVAGYCCRLTVEY